MTLEQALARIAVLEAAIRTHAECVTVCSRCGHEEPNATDDVCDALGVPTESPKAEGRGTCGVWYGGRCSLSLNHSGDCAFAATDTKEVEP